MSHISKNSLPNRYAVCATTLFTICSVTLLATGIFQCLGEANLAGIVAGSLMTSLCVYLICRLASSPRKSSTSIAPVGQKALPAPASDPFFNILSSPKYQDVMVLPNTFEGREIGNISESTTLVYDETDIFFNYVALHPSSSQLMLPSQYVYLSDIQCSHPREEICLECNSQFQASLENIFIKAFTAAKTTNQIWALHMVLPGHSTLVVIDQKKRTVEFYDSVHRYRNYAYTEAQLTNLAKQLTDLDPGSPYLYQEKMHKALQQGGNDCPIWTSYFLLERLKNPEVDFNNMDLREAQNIIKPFRRHMSATIKNMIALQKKSEAIEQSMYKAKYGDKGHKRWRRDRHAKYPEIKAGLVSSQRWRDLSNGILLNPTG